ncbi:MAG: hypothetical protein R3225_05965 [Halofilum sp. (in: g-proteobacteria)]|nr:hypothetical protein [Halofilum sp. (in: g-proteobacteria)]
MDPRMNTNGYDCRESARMPGGGVRGSWLEPVRARLTVTTENTESTESTESTERHQKCVDVASGNRTAGLPVIHASIDRHLPSDRHGILRFRFFGEFGGFGVFGGFPVELPAAIDLSRRMTVTAVNLDR